LLVRIAQEEIGRRIEYVTVPVVAVATSVSQANTAKCKQSSLSTSSTVPTLAEEEGKKLEPKGDDEAVQDDDATALIDNTQRQGGAGITVSSGYERDEEDNSASNGDARKSQKSEDAGASTSGYDPDNDDTEDQGQKKKSNEKICTSTSGYEEDNEEEEGRSNNGGLSPNPSPLPVEDDDEAKNKNDEEPEKANDNEDAMAVEEEFKGEEDEEEQQSQQEHRTQQQQIVRPGTYDGDVILRKATKIVGHFARVGDNTMSLAHFPGLLGCLIRLVTLRPYECIPWEARLSALWTLANLACNTENMQMMVCTPGLIDALVEVACRPLHHGDDLETIIELLRSRSIASRAILNLSWSPENKILLAGQSSVVDLLAELCVHRNAPLMRSRTVRSILESTRRHAVSALRSLAAAPRRTKLALCGYKNGHLLDVLTDAALNDPDTAVKDSAYGAIHNLAVQDTAETIVKHPALVLALRSVLSIPGSISGDRDRGGGGGDSDTAKTHASGTLIVLERSITPEMKDSYEILRDLLDAVNPAPAAETSSASSSDDDDAKSGSNFDTNDSEMEIVNATAV